MIRQSEQLRFLLSESPLSAIVSSLGPPARAGEWDGVDWSFGERFLYSVATRLLWRYAQAHGDAEVLSLGEPLTGSPLPVRIGGRLVSQDLANTALEVATITAHLQTPPQHILEIGAGYGRVAYALLSKFPNAKYTIVDIEPALSISRWYLTTFFDHARLTFLDPESAEDAEDADLGFSISSLQEMTQESIARYLDLLRARVHGVIFLKQWLTWKNPVDHVTVHFDDYPIPSSWRLLEKRPSPVQTSFVQAIWLTNPTSDHVGR